ncbi:hypothetical protein [Cronobacter dublinensis]|uniref:hypothetical protein n=1 Tax=Cronobacter dublinensis TaxID=413497 RepID=UPI000CFCD8EB|nr:hypothetical protein [Cronobacter dublinensis]ELH8606403.1 hypothetical protein [Enterobacter asburiae]ELH8610953.1 hypothetical protein [Enterobacter asburiae]
MRTVGGGYQIMNMAKHVTVGLNENGDIIISTPGSVFIHSGGDMTLDSGGAIHLKAMGELILEGAGVKVTSSGSYEMEAGSATYKEGTLAFEK